MSEPEFKFNHVGAYDFADKTKQKGYAESIACTNCHWRVTIYIPFGVKKKTYLEDKPCERCKCKDVLY